MQQEQDPNMQHSLEYYLYKHFIRHCAAEAPEPYRRYAATILQTEAFRIGQEIPPVPVIVRPGGKRKRQKPEG